MRGLLIVIISLVPAIALSGTNGNRSPANAGTQSQPSCTSEQMQTIQAARLYGKDAFRRNKGRMRSYLTLPEEIEVINCLERRLNQPIRAFCLNSYSGYNARSTMALPNDPVGYPIRFFQEFFAPRKRDLDDNDRWIWRTEQASVYDQAKTVVHELSHACGTDDNPHRAVNNEGNFYALWTLDETMTLDYDD